MNCTNEDLTLRSRADKFEVLDASEDKLLGVSRLRGATRGRLFYCMESIILSILKIGLFHTQGLRDECTLTSQTFSPTS